MIKISDALEQIISGNSLLEHGMEYRLFNLTQLAVFLQPMVELQTKKSVTPAALLMALSRMQKQHVSHTEASMFKFKTILLYSNLCTQTFVQTRETHRAISQIFEVISEQNGFFNQSENSREITITVDNRFVPLLTKSIIARPKYEHQNISCIETQFSKELADQPGFLHALIHKITLQNVNIIEVSATHTGFSFFVEKTDMKTVFEVLHNHFLK
jgi:aspartokinase